MSRRGQTAPAAAARADAAPAARRIDTFVARQPIYDRAMAVTAYELLYRRSAWDEHAEVTDPGQATLQVIANATLEIGLERLAGGLPVHINFPNELLLELPELPVRADHVVIEVLEDVRAQERVIESLKALRSRGHPIALDDYWPGVSDARLLDFADMVKIEVTHPERTELEQLVRALKARRFRLIAENVETPELFEQCVELGFDGFQGNFLQQPQTFGAKRIPTSRLGMLRLVASLYGEEYSVEAVERLLAQDVSLSYHVLRCVNSSFYNLPRRIDSIRQAIVILGLDALRQLCALLSLQGFDERPSSLFVNALARARMCEQLGRLAGASDTGPFFITGLLSLMNAILGLPMEKVVDELPLATPIAEALLSGTGVLGEALQCTRAYERAAWSHVRFREVPQSLIRAAYVDSLFWAEKARSLL